MNRQAVAKLQAQERKEYEKTKRIQKDDQYRK